MSDQELSTSRQTAPIPEKWIDRIFTKLTSFYGSKFAQMWAGTDLQQVKSDWAAALGSFTPDEIARGIERCLHDEWPPTLPEFLKRCRPGLEPEIAYHEAVKMMAARHSSNEHIRKASKFSHPAIFWAAAELGGDLTAGYERIKNRWQRALEGAFDRCYRIGGRWASVPDAAAALGHDKPAITDEERQAKIDKLKAELGIIGDQTRLDAQPEFTEQDRKAALEKIDKALAEQGIES